MIVTPRIRVAIAGFGPFPGVPKNPSGEIVRALGKQARFRAAGIELNTRILETAYGSTRTEIRALLAEKPDAIVLFGVAGGAKHIRVETIARNRASILHPDHSRFTPLSNKLLQTGAPALKVRGSSIRVRAAIRSTGIAAELSRNAGSYLCNAAFYEVLAATVGWNPPPLTFFIHVPPVGRFGSMGALIRAGAAAVWSVAHEAARSRIVPHRDV